MEHTSSPTEHNRNQAQTVILKNKLASEQLRHDKSKIKIIWERKIRDEIRSAESQTSIALLNSVGIFLDELVIALERSTLETPYDLGKQGMSEMHGEQRAKFAGYFLPQLLKEFSILREVIMKDLRDSDVLTYQVASIINRNIDAAISLAATEFTTVQQTATQAALEEAEKSNQDLEHFASVAAHDLKSPLATISGYLDLLIEDAREQLKTESREYISVMQIASERMRNLVDQLLDYARLGTIEKPFRSVDLNEVMKSVIQDMHDSIQKSEATVTFGKLPIVKGDSHLLAQVFQNLISNSIKFAGARAPLITFEVGNQDGSFLFTLKDNGIGFDPKDKENIFALYKRLRGETEYQGAGIGLATCKRVVELHGGRIWADSKPGFGSTFYFTLPGGAGVRTTNHH